METPKLMLIDVKTMLHSPGIWKILKVKEQSPAASGSSFRLLTWDMLEDLKESLSASGHPFQSDFFPCLNIDYTCVTFGPDGDPGAVLISSSHEGLLWVNGLYVFRPEENHTLLVMRRFLTELWLGDEDERPSKMVLLITDPKIESFIKDVLGEGYLPEEKECPREPQPDFFSALELPSPDAADLLYRDFLRKLRQEDALLS